MDMYLVLREKQERSSISQWVPTVYMGGGGRVTYLVYTSFCPTKTIHDRQKLMRFFGEYTTCMFVNESSTRRNNAEGLSSSFEHNIYIITV